MERLDTGKSICKYNEGCECDTQECDKCGWNPEVAERRLKERRLTELKLYKVPFTGYCEVWAKSVDDAAEKAEDVQLQFFAHYDYGNPVCQEKEE